MIHHRNTYLTEDQSADLLREQIVRQKAFIFARFGDGAIECITRKRGVTCDGEVYSEALGNELIRVWHLLFSKPGTYLGDWFSASFSPESPHGLYRKEYEDLVALVQWNGKFSPTWVHFEALLLMRESESLAKFYRAIRKDNRKKLLMGPKEWQPAAAILRADFFEVPVSPRLFDLYLGELKYGLKSRDFDVLLYGAGMAGNIPVVDYWYDHPEKTYINLGSALDPIYRGHTRRQQLSLVRAHRLFTGIVSR